MSNPRGRRSKNGLLLPIALTATAAVASLALYFWLGDDASSHDHAQSREDPRRYRRSRRLSHDRITEVSEPESAVEAPHQPHRPLSQKRSIAIVVASGPEDRPSPLLHHLPTPISTAHTNIFVLVYAPKISAHPLSDGSEGGTVMRQARQLFSTSPAEFIMPFTERKSVVPLLKQLAPECVYLEAGLAGHKGEVISELLSGGWVGGIVVAKGPGEAVEEGKWGTKLRVVDVSGVGDDWMAHVME